MASKIIKVPNGMITIYFHDKQPLFCVDEFTRLLGYTSKSYLKNYYGFPMVEEKYTYLDNILDFLNRARKPFAKDIAKLILKELNVKYVTNSCVEMKLIETIIDFTSDAYELQFMVDTYKIDMYLPAKKIAIEIDERGHSDRNKIYEQHREQDIIKKLGCKFIRINPDEIGFSKRKMIKNLKENGVTIDI